MEVAHEALIREWPTLRAWLSEDRDSLRLHRHLTEAARSWEELDREPGELYRGARLAQAWNGMPDIPDELNELEEISWLLLRRRASRRSLSARLLASGKSKLPGALQSPRSSRAEEQARTAQRFRWLAAVLAVLLLAAVAMASFALQQRQQARTAALLSRLARAGGSSSEQLERRSRTQRLAGPGGCEAHRYRRGSQCASPGRSGLQVERHAPGERA